MAIVSIQEQLRHLQLLLNAMTDASYTQSINMLGGTTIGQHLRHIVELMQCLDKGYATGIINYDDRLRDARIENNRNFALDAIRDLYDNLDREEKALQLVTCGINDKVVLLDTWYCRELVYNTEHAIHHMAMIRVALRELSLDLVNDHFGVAKATIQYQQQCAQ
jgi:uncharacterized damage-inducible protein DinB